MIIIPFYPYQSFLGIVIYVKQGR